MKSACIKIYQRIRMLVHVPLFALHLFLYLKSSNRSAIHDDVQAWGNRLELPVRGEIYSLLYLLVYFRTFRSLFYVRIQNIPKIFKLLCPGYKGLIIHKDTIIAGGGLFFYHPHSTIINAKSIGRNCTIRHLTTIGNKGNDVNEKPTLLDDVNVGAHAIIIGDIVIGNHVSIGAGAVVTKDVPDNCVVAGNPAQIIRRDGIPVNRTP